MTPVLNEMFAWATTVVRIKINTNEEWNARNIDTEIRDFDANFLLFLSSDFTLELENSQNEKRIISRRKLSDELIEISDDKDSHKWRIFSTMVTDFPKEASADWDSRYKRDEYPIFWALSENNADACSGKFWAFFKTEIDNKVPGIVNANWKIGTDRASIEKGPYNDFLMKKAAEFIAAKIEEIAKEKNPTLFDFLPRRCENKDEICYRLVHDILEKLLDKAIILNGKHELCCAKDIRMPVECSMDKILEPLAKKYGDDTFQTSYPNIEILKKQDRRRRLFGFLKQQYGNIPFEDNLSTLFSHVCYDQTNAAEFFGFFESVSKSSSYNLDSAKFIFCADEKYHSVSETVLNNANGLKNVYKVNSILDNAVIKNLLKDMGVVDSGNKQLADILDKKAKALKSAKKTELIDAFFNELAPKFRTDENLVGRTISQYARNDLLDHLTAKTFASNAIQPNLLFVLAPSDATALFEDGVNQFLLAPSYPNEIRRTAIALGASEQWNSANVIYTDGYFRDTGIWAYRSECENDYKANYSNMGKTREFCFSHVNFFKSLHLLPFIKDAAAKSELTEKICNILLSDSKYYGNASIGHGAAAKHAPDHPIVSPNLFGVYSHGTVNFYGEHLSVGAIVNLLREKDGLLDLIRSLDKEFNDFCTKLNLAYASFTPKLEFSNRTLKSQLIKAALSQEFPCELFAKDNIISLIDFSLDFGVEINGVNIDGTWIPKSECFVTDSRSLAEVVVDVNADKLNAIHAIFLPTESYKKCISYGFKNLNDYLILNGSSEDESPQILKFQTLPDSVLAIQSSIDLNISNLLVLSACDNSINFPLCVFFYKVNNTWYCAKDFDKNSVELKKYLIYGLNDCGLFQSKDDFKKELTRVNTLAKNQHIDQIKKETNIAKKILLATNNKSTEYLDPILGADIVKLLKANNNYTPEMVAEVCLAMEGPCLLSKLASALEAEGLYPPQKWGSPEAQDFVERFAFPNEFACSPNKKRAGVENILGHINLGPLHDYQQEILNELTKELKNNRNMRTMVCLPTGAGKTRIAMEFLVENVLNKRGSVLWIANTDELCEQSVQSIIEIWHNKGKLPDVKYPYLKISRYWGSQQDPSIEDGKANIIISSIQTITAHPKSFLSIADKVSIVVFDEAHHSTARTYNDAITVLSQKNKAVLGLSATPFRTLEDESPTLVQLYKRNVIPAISDYKEIVKNLQLNGNLAYPTFTNIDTIKIKGLDIDKFISDNVPIRDLEKNELRNQFIVEFIKRKLKKKKRILFFALTKAHAKYISAALVSKGIKAAYIDGDSISATRRYNVREFSNGNINVLCNYMVLTTGFDVPSIDMIFITRPVKSLNTLMQMIGRGLRGPKNGGKKYCEICSLSTNIPGLSYKAVTKLIDELW